MSTTTLTLHDGSTVTYTDAELGQTLTRLQSQNQSFCLGASDVAHIRVGGSLLLMDVGWISGRKLIEGYLISADTLFPFGVKFTQGQATYTLDQALAGVGYFGSFVTALPQVFMEMYNAGVQAYLVGSSNAVKSVGAFQTAAAELKSIAAGSNVTITDSGNALTIAADLTAVTVDIATNTADIALNTTDIATKQATLATGNPSAPHVKILDVGATTIKALTSSAGITLVDATTHIEVSAPSLANKQDQITATAPLSLASNGTLSVDLSTYASLVQVQQNTADIATKQDVITPTAPLSLVNGALSVDLSTYASLTQVQQNSTDIAANASALALKQDSLDAAADFTVDVGRGSVFFESNSSYDSASGAGLTIRTNNNPGTDAPILAVRSSGHGCRFWVGQEITTPGDNAFHCGYTGAIGEEYDTTKYKHSLTDTLVQFGTPVQCDYDLTVSGTLTAASLYGGAATQITTQITNEIASAALTPHGGSGNSLLNAAVPTGKLANIFGAGPVVVSAVWDPGQPDHGNIQIGLSLARFSAYASVASAAFNTGTVTVPIDTVGYNTGSSDFTLSSNVITMNRAMLCLVSYNGSLNITSTAGPSNNDRTSARFMLKQTSLGGGGYSTVPGSTGYTYNRTSAEGEGSASASIIVAFASGDELYLETSKESPSDTTMKTIADACSITIIEV